MRPIHLLGIVAVALGSTAMSAEAWSSGPVSETSLSALPKPKCGVELAPLRCANPFIYTATALGNTLEIIDPAIPAVVGSIPVGTEPDGVVVGRDGSRVYVSNRKSEDVMVIDVMARQVIATIPVGQDPMGIVVDPRGERLWVANRMSHTIMAIDLGSRKVVATIPVSGWPVNLAMTSAGDRIFVGKACTASFAVTDACSLGLIADIPNPDSTGQIALSPDGSRLYLGGVNGVWVRDATTYKPLGTIPMRSPVQGLLVSPSSDIVYVSAACGGACGFIAEVDAESLEILRELPDVLTGGLGLDPTGATLLAPTHRDQIVRVETSSMTIMDRITVRGFPREAAMQRPCLP